MTFIEKSTGKPWRMIRRERRIGGAVTLVDLEGNHRTINDYELNSHYESTVKEKDG